MSASYYISSCQQIWIFYILQIVGCNIIYTGLHCSEMVNIGANVVRALARCACEGGRSGH